MSSSNDATAKLVEAAKIALLKAKAWRDIARDEGLGPDDDGSMMALESALSALPPPSPAVAVEDRQDALEPLRTLIGTYGVDRVLSFMADHLRLCEGHMSPTNQEAVRKNIAALELAAKTIGENVPSPAPTPPAPESVPTAEEVAEQVRACSSLGAATFIIQADRDRLARRVAELEKDRDHCKSQASHWQNHGVHLTLKLREANATIAELRALLRLARLAEVRGEALEKIRLWKLPPATDRNGKPSTFETEFGSQGAKNYIRAIAASALDAAEREGSKG